MFSHFYVLNFLLSCLFTPFVTWNKFIIGLGCPDIFNDNLFSKGTQKKRNHRESSCFRVPQTVNNNNNPLK
jgi:hypothetical protein